MKSHESQGHYWCNAASIREHCVAWCVPPRLLSFRRAPSGPRWLASCTLNANPWSLMGVGHIWTVRHFRYSLSRDHLFLLTSLSFLIPSRSYSPSRHVTAWLVLQASPDVGLVPERVAAGRCKGSRDQHQISVLIPKTVVTWGAQRWPCRGFGWEVGVFSFGLWKGKRKEKDHYLN